MEVREDGTVVISNHSLKNITLCDTKATLVALGYEGLPETKTLEEAPLKCGIAIHEAMANYFVNGNKVQSLGIFKRYYQRWSDKYVPQEHRLSYDNVYRVIDHWFDSHPLELLPFKVIPEFVECSFEIPLTEDGKVILSGRPDALATDKRGKICIIDHKTMSRLDDSIQVYELDAQMSGYYYVARAYGLDAQAIWINAIELKKLNSSTKNCPKHKTAFKNCAPQHLRSDLVEFMRSEQLLNEWYKTAVATALKIRALVDKTPSIEYIGRQRMQGMFNGECKYCPFSKFCATGRKPELANKLLVKKQ